MKTHLEKVGTDVSKEASDSTASRRGLGGEVARGTKTIAWGVTGKKKKRKQVERMQKKRTAIRWISTDTTVIT
eukprot:235962-Pleurochrysis_carterae.AAC.4